jgi:Spy/CpxP family protein refolding chaperone
MWNRLASVLVAIGMFVGGCAQQSFPGLSKPAPGSHPLLGLEVDTIPRLEEKIDLTPAQKLDIRALWSQDKREVYLDLDRARFMARHQALERVMATQPFDPGAVAALVREWRADAAAYAQGRARLAGAVRAVLTANQRAKLVDVLAGLPAPTPVPSTNVFWSFQRQRDGASLALGLTASQVAALDAYHARLVALQEPRYMIDARAATISLLRTGDLAPVQHMLDIYVEAFIPEQELVVFLTSLDASQRQRLKYLLPQIEQSFY